MPNFYASHADIIETKPLCAAHWIYTLEEADNEYYAIIHEMEWIIKHLQKMLLIQGTIYYAVSRSQSPFQVTHIGDRKFVILVDGNAFYELVFLCFRIQTLSPLAEHLGSTPLDVQADYSGQFLLDIVKQFLANPIDLGSAIDATKSRMVNQAALLFIIGHEIAHISHGHLLFKTSEEFKNFAADENDENLTLRTFEMDADSSGTTNVFATMEHVIAAILESGKELSDQEKLTKISFLRAQYTTGIFVALLYSDARLKNFFTPKYPMSYARFLTASSVLSIVLRKDIGEEEAKIPENVRQNLIAAFVKLSSSLGSLGHPVASNIMVFNDNSTGPDYHYSELGQAIGHQQLEPLYSRWSKLRPCLERYQLGGKLAPAIADPF